MSLRRAAVLVGLLTFACAGQKPASAPTPSPAGPAPAAATGGAAAAPATPAKPPPPPPPTDAELVATASAAIGAQQGPLADAVAASADKKLTSARYETASATLAELDAILAAAHPAEARKPDWAKMAASTRAAVAKTRADLAALWLEVGLPQQKAAVDAALRQATQALNVAKQKTATEELVAKAEAAIKALPPLLARGAPLEAKDAKYGQQATSAKTQVTTLDAGLAEARAALTLRTQFAELQAAVEPARKAATEAVAPLAKSPEPAAIDAADKAVAAVEAALAAGKAVIDANKAHADYAAAVTKEVEARKVAIALARQNGQVLAERARIDAAESDLEARVGVYRTTPSPEAHAAADKAARDLDAVLKANAELAAKDKALAARVAAAAKKLAAQQVVLIGLDAEQKIAAHKVEVAALRAKVTETLAALAGKLEYDAYAAAGRDIEALEKAIDAGAPLGTVNAKYGAELKAAKAEIPGLEMQVRRVWIAATEAEVKARIEALAGKPDSAAFAAAEKAVKTMGTTVESSKSPTKQDKSYLAFLAASEKQVAAYGQQIQARRGGLVVEAFRARVDQAAQAAEAAVVALDGTPAPAAFDAAESAVKALERESEPDATQAASEQAYLAAQRKKAVEYKARVAKRRVEVMVAAHRAQLVEASEALAAKLQALAGEVTDAALADAGKAVTALDEVVTRGADAGKADAKYAQELTAAKNKLAPARADIERRKVGAEVAASRAKLDAANAALTEKLGAIGGQPGAASFDAAAAATEALEASIAEAKSIADPKHAAVVAGLEKKLAEQRARIARGRLDLEIATHRAAIEAQKAKVQEAIGALDGKVENGPYVAAEKQVGSLAAVLSSGSAIAEKDPKYAQELKNRAGEVPALVMQIRRKRIDVAAAIARERLDALVATPDAGALSGAEGAIEDVVGAIENARTFKTEDRGYAAALATADKNVAADRARVEKGKTALAIVAHRGTVEAAQAEVAKRLDGLGKSLEYELYNGADQAVTALEKALTGGAELGAKDAAYGKVLAAGRGQIEGHRIAIRAKWIDAARAAVDEKIAALAGKPADKAFKAAEDALVVMSRTVESGRTLSKVPSYQAMLAASDKHVAAQRAAIERRRVELVVEARAAEVDAAEAGLAERMKALDEKPNEGAFKAAEAAVTALSSTLEASADAAAKDAKYAQRIAALKGKVPGFKGGIEAKRVEAEVAAHRAKLDAAREAVRAQMEALASVSEDAALGAADRAIEELDSVIGGGKSAGDKAPKYAAELAAESKKLPAYRASVVKRRGEIAVATHEASVVAAEQAATDALAAAQEKPGNKAFDAAEAALAALEEKLGEREKFAKTSPAHAARLAKAAQELPKRRAAVARARTSIAIAAHRKLVEAETEKVAEKLAGLGKSLEYELYNGASQQVTALEKAIAAGAELGTQDAAYGKELKAASAQIDGHRITVRQKWIEAANAVVQAKVEALAEKPDERAFKAAEDAVGVLEKTVASGKELTKTPSYLKLIAGWEKQVGATRAQIEKRRSQLVVEAHAAELAAAEAKLAERMGALGVGAEDGAFKSAESAVEALASTLEAGSDAAAKDPKHAQRIAGLRGKIAGFKGAIAAKRVEAEVGAHRAKLEVARAAVREQLEALASVSEDAALGAADRAIEELDSVIGGGKSAGDKAPKYAAELAAETKKLPAYRASVVKRRGEIAVATHEASVVAAEQAATDALAAAQEKPGNKAFDAAEAALAALEEKLGEREKFIKTSPAHAARLAKAAQELPKRRAAVARARTSIAIAAHRKLVEAETEKVAEKLAGLGKSLEYELYNGASQQVTALEKAIAAGAELGAQDAAYGKELKAASAQIDGDRIMVRQKWIEAANAVVQAKVEALAEKPDERAFKAAEDAVGVLEKTVASGKELTKTPSYLKLIAGWEKQVGTTRSQIDKRRSQLVVEAHAAELAAAEAKLAERMGALGVGAEDGAFKSAESAVDDLVNTLDGGAEAAAKDPAYAKRIAGLRGKVPAMRTGIAAKRVAAEVGAHKAKLEVARAAVREQLEALAGASEDGALGAADRAIEELDSVIGGGKSAGEKAPKYASELAAETKKLPAYRASVAKRRNELTVARHAAEVESAQQAATDALTAAEEKPGNKAFDAAEAALAALEEKLGEREKFAKTSPAHAARLAKAAQELPKRRAQIARAKAAIEIAAHRKLVEEETEKVAEKLAGLGKSLEYELYNGASQQVTALEKALAAGEELGTKDPAYGKELKAAAAQIDGHRITVRQKWIEAANAAVQVKLEALEEKPDERAFKAAEDAVSVLEKTVASGKELTKTPSYLKLIAGWEKQAATTRAQIDKRRVRLVVDAHATELAAAEAKLAERMGALGNGADDGAFKAAAAAVDDLVNTIDGGAEAAAKDPAYAKRIAGLRGKVPAMRTGIAAKRVAAEVGAHKAKLDAARGSVRELLDAMAKGKDGSQFTAAEQAIGELESVIDSGKSAGEVSPKYAAELAAEGKKLGGYRARVAQRRVEVDLAAHAAELAEAQGALAEAVKGLSGASEKAAFEEAEEALGKLEEAIEGGARFAKNPAHAKRLAAAKADVPKKRAAIASARIAIEVAAQRKAVEAAAAEAAERVAALDDGITPSSVKAAEGAVSALESATSASGELAKKSPAYAKSLAVYPKKIAELRKTIARRAVEKEIEAHKTEVVEATAAVSERLAKLGTSLEYDLYNDASLSVNALDKVLDAGDALAERDPGYGKAIKGLRGKLDGYRITVRQKWIEAANAAATEKLASMSDESSFDAAEEAVTVLERTIESGKTLTPAAGYQKSLAVWEKKAAGARARIGKRKIELAVNAHKTELQQAEAAVASALGALKDKPEEAGVKAANAAVEELLGTLDGASDAVAKDPTYGKRIAATRAKLPAMRATIERGRFNADVAGVRERINTTLATVEEKLGALGASAEAAQFSQAEDAVADLDSALADGKGFAADNKVYAKELAGQQKKLPAFRKRIAKLKVDIELAGHVRALDEAAGAVTEAVAALGSSPNKEAFDAAEEAVGELDEAIADGAKLAKASPTYGRKLAVLKKELPKKRATIARARISGEVAEHKKALDAARAEAETRVEQLGNGISPASVKAAENAVSSLATVVDEGKAIAKKSPPHAKLLASYPKVVAELKRGIKRREVEVELKGHRQEMAEAEAAVAERMAELGSSLEYELYNSAEQAVNALDKVIGEGAELADRDDRYAKELKVARSKIEGHRIAVRQKWIAAARAAVDEKMGALAGKADDGALEAASSAVTVLERTIESGKSVSKSKPYQKSLAIAAKQASGFAKAIDRRRSQAEFAEVRAELDAAVTEATSAMKAAGSDPEAADAAKKALGTLADAIDANVPAAAKDAAHKKRLALLRKKLAGDRAKLTRLASAADSKRELADVIEAEVALSDALDDLKKKGDQASVDAAEEAASALDSAVSSKSGSGDAKAKRRYAAAKKKVSLARIAIKRVQGEAGVSEHRAEVEIKLASARQAMAGVSKGGDRDSISEASTSVDALMDLVSSGRDLGKQNKKYGVYLASVKKTALKFQKILEKSKPRDEPAEEAEQGEDPRARLVAAQGTLKQTLSALTKRANEDTLSAAKVALEDLSDSVEASRAAAKKSKALAKKVAVARAQLAKAKPLMAKMEAKVAKAAAKAASASEDSAPEGDAEVDPRRQLAAAWAEFTHQIKAMKGKKPNSEQVDAALEAADAVDAALEEGARSRLSSTSKYKKLASSIKKRLKVERGKLTKRKRALAGTRSKSA